MKSFKEAAIAILIKAGKPLHYREITKLAIEQHLIEPEGLTPSATMSATLSTDVANSIQSSFYRSEPGYYGLIEGETAAKPVKPGEQPGSAQGKRLQINEDLNTKQKGDIAEARVAELITLYGKEGLSCYKPTSDHEGIDLIVKRRDKLEVSFIQVKSTFGYGNHPGNGRGFVSTVRDQSIKNEKSLFFVFVYFDLSIGDLYNHIFCIPAPQFLDLTKNDAKQSGRRVFTVGLSHPEKSKFAEFMIEKGELADKIIELMNRV